MRVERIGDATLYLGDCRDILPTLGPVDAVVTDPPYGQSYKAPAPRPKSASSRGLNGGWKRRGDRPTADRVIGDGEKPDLSALLLMAPQVLIWGVHKLAGQLPDGQWLVWDKRVDLPPIDQGDAEAAWVNRDGPMRVIRHKWSGLIIESGSEEAQRVPGTSGAQARLHPTQKPVRVMRWSIEQLKPAPDVVLDPYMGSGSTGVACAQLGRRFIGIEIDPVHFDTACRRIEEEGRQPSLFATPPRESPTQLGLLDACGDCGDVGVWTDTDGRRLCQDHADGR